MTAAELAVTVKKSERFVRRLFQAAVEIINKTWPKATDSDFHGCGSFLKLPLPQLSFFFGPFFFLCENHTRFTESLRARIVYRRRSPSRPTRGMPVFRTIHHTLVGLCRK
jgi:hypothetical protein